MSGSNYFSDVLTAGGDFNSSFITDCFKHFAKEGKDFLNLACFALLSKQLFSDASGKSYEIKEVQLQTMFHCLDLNGDGKIDKEEFVNMCEKFLIPVLKPKSAFIVIDVQNDFIDGSLALKNCPAQEDGLEVVDVINNVTKCVEFNNVIYTYDWHPDDHVSFVDNVALHKFADSSPVKPEDAKVFDTVVFEGPTEFQQKLWPKHCVQNSWGSRLHSKLSIVDDAIFIYKGKNSNIDSYSAFWDNNKLSQTELDNILKSKGITDVYICGLAYDFCVAQTAFDALDLGYRTVIVDDACRGTDKEGIEIVKRKVASLNGARVTSTSVQNMVLGKDRRPELGYAILMPQKKKK